MHHAAAVVDLDKLLFISNRHIRRAVDEAATATAPAGATAENVTASTATTANATEAVTTTTTTAASHTVPVLLSGVAGSQRLSRMVDVVWPAVVRLVQQQRPQQQHQQPVHADLVMSNDIGVSREYVARVMLMKVHTCVVNGNCNLTNGRYRSAFLYYLILLRCSYYFVEPMSRRRSTSSC